IETSGPHSVQMTPRTRTRRTMGVVDIVASSTHQPPIPTTIPSPDYHGDINAEPLHELTHVVLGNHVMSPVYPHSYPRRPIGNATIAGYQFVCQYCFKYTVDVEHAAVHSVYIDPL